MEQAVVHNTNKKEKQPKMELFFHSNKYFEQKTCMKLLFFKFKNIKQSYFNLELTTFKVKYA